MSVMKSVWPNWETGLDFRTRTERGHCALGNIVDRTVNAVFTRGLTKYS